MIERLLSTFSELNISKSENNTPGEPSQLEISMADQVEQPWVANTKPHPRTESAILSSFHSSSNSIDEMCRFVIVESSLTQSGSDEVVEGCQNCESSNFSSLNRSFNRVDEKSELVTVESHPLSLSDTDEEFEETLKFSLEKYISKPSNPEPKKVEVSSEFESEECEEVNDLKCLTHNPDRKYFELLTNSERSLKTALKSKDECEIDTSFNKCSEDELLRLLIWLKEDGDIENLERLLKTIHSPSHSLRATVSRSAGALDLVSEPKNSEPKNYSEPVSRSTGALDLASEPKNYSEPDSPQPLSSRLLANYFFMVKDYKGLDEQIKSGLEQSQIKSLFKRASASGDLNVINMLLETSQIDINEPIDGAGNTALHIATHNFNFRVIEFLLEHDASTEIKNANEETALVHWVTSPGKDTTPEPFINKITGETIFHVVVRLRCPKLVKYMVAQGVPVNYWHTPAEPTTEKGALPNRTELGMAIESGDLEMVKILISAKNISHDRTAAPNFFPLGLAIELNRPDLVKLMLEDGFSASGSATLEHKAIHLAAHNGQTEILRLLTQYGAGVNDLNQSCCNPMACALKNGHFKSATLLKELGAEPLLGLPEAWSPFKEVGTDEHGGVQLLVDRDTKNCVIHEVLESNPGYLELFLPYIERKSDWWYFQENKIGYTPFDLAVKTGNTELVRKMLDYSKAAKTINRTSKTTGKSPLMLAIEAQDVEMVKLLIKSGANPNAFGEGMTPPLILAVNSGNAELFQAMLVPGLNINIQDQNGKTALHYAVDSKEAILVKLMFKFQENHSFWSEYGKSSWEYKCYLLSQIKSNVVDDRGRLPLRYAIDSENKLAIQYLLNHGTDLSSPLNNKSPQDIDSLLDNGASIYYRANSGQRSPLAYAIKSAPLDIIIIMIEETAKRYSLQDYTGMAFRLGYILDHRPKEFVKIAGLLKKHNMCFLDNVTSDQSEGKIIAKALSSGQIENANWLIENYKSRVHQGLLIRNANEQNLLHLATKIHGNHSIKPLLNLIPRGYLFKPDKDGMYPIHYAIRNKNITAVKELSEKMRVYVFHKPSDQTRSAVGYALNCAPPPIIKVMLEQAIKDPDLSGMRLQQFRLEYLLERRPDDFMEIIPMLKRCNACCVDLKLTFKGGNHILSRAILLGRIDIVNWVIQNFESESKKLLTMPNDNGQNLLHVAVMNYQSNLLQPLLSLMPKECLFKFDNNGKLPIHYAVQNGNLLAAKDIVEQMGENWNTPDSHGVNVIAYAALWGQVELLQELERLNLLSSEDLYQSNAQHSLHVQATMSDSAEMIDYLTEHHFDFHTPSNIQGKTLSEMAIGSLKLKTWLKLRRIDHQETDSISAPKERKKIESQQLEGFVLRAANALEKAASENEKDITRELLFYISEVIDLKSFTSWMIQLGKLESLKVLKRIEIPEALQTLESEFDWIAIAREFHKDEIAQWLHEEQSHLSD
ncbi:ankyrin repeat domain-containing protein [Shewanella sp. 202IG2-18]|uniref:ankyrin repeat domain-containing protein n=1 Tax=Parashewanella hymeniacidonis TaxID=2807618 RepID=UPI001961FD07|nr:ankyrin repeat domain-containing protein [Parashewanella hymeniacidonis]MBM7071467.1 ankyrin repeat domain-containing protein [Parashewanella hymeniacidonis]